MKQKNEFQLKGILIDVDGTLTNSKREISLSTIQTVKAVQNHNIPISICTGRHYAALKNYILPLFKKDSLHIIAGGGEIIKMNGDVVWKSYISSDSVRSIIQNVERLGGACIFGRNSYLYASDSVFQNISAHPWKISVRRNRDLKNYETSLLSVIQINSRVIEYIKQVHGLSIQEMKKGEEISYFDITAEDVNKATTAEIWSKLNAIPLSNILVVGDNLNDYKLFLRAGKSVAMGHSPQEIKKIAHEVTLSTDKNGLAITLQHVVDLISSS